jgi:hypothetical protein
VSSATSPGGPAAGGDYVVRHGWRGFAGNLAGLAAWTALIVAGRAGHWPHFGGRGILVLLAVEAAFALACAAQLRQALARQVVFAVRGDGVFLGPDQDDEAVPWSQICAVELFRERVPRGQSRSSYRCVGLRTPGTSQVPRAGSGTAAQPLPEPSAADLLRSGRPDLIPGADGTIRLAYRRMSGWRVSRARLTAAVREYAPAVPVIDSPDWPPALSWGDAHRAFPRDGR